ncbi:MAG TPA: gamma-glutamyltransferase [Acidobacteriaceae bacterium]|jgi:gamma-glutamyltranspeptidase/glutathione hydrolase
MTILFRSKLVTFATLALFTTATLAQATSHPGEPIPPTPPVRTRHAMVVTIQHNATDAGVEILRAGGNAVDAAVAVGFALAVTFPAAGNLGGGGFMLIRPGSQRLAQGRPHFLDFREKAPAAASANMYLDAHGNVIPRMSIDSPQASGVPGTVAGLVYAERHYGRLGLRRVMAPAIRFASQGFVLTDEEARSLHSGNLTKFPTSRRIFQRDGNFYKGGDRLIQPELAATLREIAANPASFYHGAIAQQIAAYEKANGGLITAQDLANYEVKEREPLIGHYRGLEVLTSPPPSSGGIVLIEILNILSGYDLTHLNGAASPDRSPAQVHTIAEAFRRAYMDRADFLGDPDFNPHMPLEQMADPAYAAAWRKTIDPVKPSPSATLVRPAGFMPQPPKLAPIVESNQTTHFSVVDADGNAVAMTYTLNFGFGNGMTVDKLGFLLNDEMDDFASKMGVPNGFGLIQGPANAIAPGKRPLSCMTPTIVSEPPVCRTLSSRPRTPQFQATHGASVCTPGKLRLVLGSPGGSTIITTVANDLISVVDNGLDIQAAADAPRFHHQYLPDTLQFEKAFPQDVVSALATDGYNTERAGAKDFNSPGIWGDSELIARDPSTSGKRGELTGGQDHRHHFGKAAGY